MGVLGKSIQALLVSRAAGLHLAPVHFCLDVLMSGVNGCRDGQRPREEEMHLTEAAMARWHWLQ